MRALFATTFAATLLLSGMALADEAKPVDQSQLFQLTAAQMDTVTAGAGRSDKNLNAPAPMSGNPPWSALFVNAGHFFWVIDAGSSGITVDVPRQNPQNP